MNAIIVIIWLQMRVPRYTSTNLFFAKQIDVKGIQKLHQKKKNLTNLNNSSLSPSFRPKFKFRYSWKFASFSSRFIPFSPGLELAALHTCFYRKARNLARRQYIPKEMGMGKRRWGRALSQISLHRKLTLVDSLHTCGRFRTQKKNILFLVLNSRLFSLRCCFCYDYYSFFCHTCRSIMTCRSSRDSNNHENPRETKFWMQKPQLLSKP